MFTAIKSLFKTPAKISVLIPAFNEAGNIIPLMDKVNLAFKKHKLNGEVILVDDGSTDSTFVEMNVAMKKLSFIKVFSHKKNRGLTEAINTGLQNAKGEIIVFLPGDGESDPYEDIPKLVNKIEEGYDVALGWRQGRKGGKVFASKIYNLVCRWLFKLNVHDMNWIKAFRREVIDDLHLRSDWHRYMVMIAASQGYKIGEVSTNWYPRQHGKSKFGLWRVPVSFLDVIVVKFLLTFRRKPMLFFGSIGLGSIMASLLIGIFLVFQYLLYQQQTRPFFTFGIFLALAGLLMFLVGFLAELIVDQQGRIDEIERRTRKL